jgi:regulatory protein
MEEEKYQKVKDYAYKLLSIRQRSVAEITKMLTRYCTDRDIPTEYVSQIVDHLKEMKYLDDEKFAFWYANSYMGDNAKGKFGIQMGLSEKGIDKELIEKVMSGLGDYEFEAAQNLALKKLKDPKNIKMNGIEKRVMDYLFRRGFSWSLIRRVIDSIRKKAYNME